jgi:3-phosphoshikimate 1-carboxyvinyltransferase
VLFAGMRASGSTRVTEPAPSRDHTERMLAALGVPLERDDRTVSIVGGHQPQAFTLDVPGDASSAAFFFAAAALGDGCVQVYGVGLNESRIAFLRVLERMGATVTVSNQREELGEPVGDVKVVGPVTQTTEIHVDEVPSMLDELPLVGLVATAVRGTTSVRGAEELRVKESDRIAATCQGLLTLGASIVARPDGFDVTGPTALHGAQVDSAGDHRIAMMLAIAGTKAKGATTILGAEAASISYPGFADSLRALGVDIDVE